MIELGQDQRTVRLVLVLQLLERDNFAFNSALLELRVDKGLVHQVRPASTVIIPFAARAPHSAFFSK